MARYKAVEVSLFDLGKVRGCVHRSEVVPQAFMHTFIKVFVHRLTVESVVPIQPQSEGAHAQKKYSVELSRQEEARM